MKYGYVRVSSQTQNIDRQLEEMYKHGLTDEFIYIDKQSGKDFERKNYQELIAKLMKEDYVLIKSIDRLGRNYKMIIEEWHRITKIIEADIFVIDMPLLDTKIEDKNLVGRFISDLVLQILSFVAENERENIRQRQAEGIRIAREKGKHLGRPPYIIPSNGDDIFQLYMLGKINSAEALELLHLSNATFYKYYKQYYDRISDSN